MIGGNQQRPGPGNPVHFPRGDADSPQRGAPTSGKWRVEFHKQKITEKLGIHTGTVVTAYAIRHGTAYAEQGFAVTSRYRLCRTPPD